MKESVEVHYRIVKHSDIYYKVYLPTDGGSRTWLSWVGPHWERVQNDEKVNHLNRLYNKKIQSNEE